MSISNVSGAGVNPYAYTNRSQKAAGTGNFAEEVQKAAEGKNAAEKSGSSAWAGDMVINYPPNLAKVSNSEYSNASEPPFYRLRATSDFNTLEPPQTQDIVMEP